VRTQSQTQTLILVPQTVTAGCAGGTRTVTNYAQGPTVTVSSTVLRTATEGQVTSVWTTTATATASCHFPQSGSPPSTVYDGPPSALPTGFCIGETCQTFGPPAGGKGKGKGKGGRPAVQRSNRATPAEKRDVAATAAIGAVAAVTSTYTQTTYTVTSTVQTTIPGRVTTEVGEWALSLSLFLSFSLLSLFSWHY